MDDSRQDAKQVLSDVEGHPKLGEKNFVFLTIHKVRIKRWES